MLKLCLSQLLNTTLSLIEQNKSLVKEVRFADQTCVELSEKNRYYKTEVGRYKRDLSKATKQVENLRTSHGTTSNETSRLKGMVESLTSQLAEVNRHSNVQNESYRTQIHNSEQ